MYTIKTICFLFCLVPPVFGMNSYKRYVDPYHQKVGTHIWAQFCAKKAFEQLLLMEQPDIRDSRLMFYREGQFHLEAIPEPRPSKEIFVMQIWHKSFKGEGTLMCAELKEDEQEKIIKKTRNGKVCFFFKKSMDERFDEGGPLIDVRKLNNLREDLGLTKICYKEVERFIASCTKIGYWSYDIHDKNSEKDFERIIETCQSGVRFVLFSGLYVICLVMYFGCNRLEFEE